MRGVVNEDVPVLGADSGAVVQRSALPGHVGGPGLNLGPPRVRWVCARRDVGRAEASGGLEYSTWWLGLSASLPRFLAHKGHKYVIIKKKNSPVTAGLKPSKRPRATESRMQICKAASTLPTRGLSTGTNQLSPEDVLLVLLEVPKETKPSGSPETTLTCKKCLIMIP